MSPQSRITFILHALLACLLMVPVMAAEHRLYVNYASDLSGVELASFDTCILDPDAEINLSAVRKPNQTFLAYVSTVEARPGSALARAAKEKNVPALTRNEAWDSLVLDVTSEAWDDAVMEVAAAAAAKGFDGLFLDTIDSIALLKDQGDAKDAVLKMLQRLRKRFPAAKLVINRGFDLLPQVHSFIDGVLVESVYQTCDAKSENFHAVSEKDNAWVLARIRETQQLGLQVYAVDYVEPSKPDLAAETAKKLRELKCIPFISTPALDGTVPVTSQEVKRRILVLFGWDPRFADKPVTWPIDTLTAGHFQVFLEWLGYELDYLDIGKKEPASAANYAGVIVDQSIKLRPDQEEALAGWLLSAREQHVPLLFAGGIPFNNEDVTDRLARALECGGSFKSLHRVSDVAIAHIDSDMMNAEAEVSPRQLMFQEITAPASAKVFLSLKARDSIGDETRSDSVFLASWGGAWLEPYIAQRATQEHRRFYADPLRFLRLWLDAAPRFPVPDATTMNGRRLFYSHIDGDGFSSLSHFPGHPTCAEVVRDEVLKKYPLPVTVSVIEAEMHGWLKASKPEDAPRMQEIARSIFALPNVQPASHTFTHPFQMFATDSNPGHYSQPHAPLNDAVTYPAIDARREINGSIDFINKNLLPAGKRVELLLWPGNTRPGTEALKLCRELGVENMNGGDTIISRVYPGVAGIAPRTCPWDDELQVFAANQNEFMYADGFTGPFYGGFETVIDTFKMTETPRRMKPVNVYYHFYSSTFVSSLRALQHIYDWCLTQSLQPVTALQYAKLVRDVRDAKVRQLGPSHWQIASHGELRTLRIESSMGVPDLTRSHGVLGWTTHEGSHYIHTDGRKLVDLVLTKNAQPHWRLVEASGALNVTEFSAHRMTFTAHAWTDAIDLTFAGLPPKAAVSQGVIEHRADDEGVLRLKLPVTAEPVTLEVASYVSGK